MCTVLLRYAPEAPWPLLVAAVRDEFLDRPWDPPAAHWPDAPELVGGRDRSAGGTWLAVRRDRPAVAALLNGVRRPAPATGTRPTRGRLPIAALTGQARLESADLAEYDGFHLLLGTPERVVVWSWDGEQVQRRELDPGDHIVVNLGVNAIDDPLVPHFAPLLKGTAEPSLDGNPETVTAWGPWVDLLRGDGLPGDDPRALLVRKEIRGAIYGSSSASLVAISAHQSRFDFTAGPALPQWTQVPLGR